MPEHFRNREWLEEEVRESSVPGLPRADLNPLVNPLLAQNMGRWAQVYFTSAPDHREQAVEKLLEELQSESGGKKPARPENVQKPDLPPPTAVPRSSTEIEFPELPVPGSSAAKPKPAPDDTLAEDLIVCSGCMHKNAAEQRFCGICGRALSKDAVAVPKPQTAPQAAAASGQVENPESDWRWLREKTLSSYDVGSEPRSASRVLPVFVILLLIVAGGYFVWQSRSSHEQAPASAPTVPEPSSGPAINLPIATTPTTTAPQPTRASEPKTPVVPPKVAPAPAASVNAKTASSGPSGVSPSDNGGDELDQARRYLSGEGVPRNSWMASQLLWKAIRKQNSDAVLLLSDLYARGDGVPRSCEQARVLLVSAAKKGSPAAAQKLRAVETGCR